MYNPCFVLSLRVTQACKGSASTITAGPLSPHSLGPAMTGLAFPTAPIALCASSRSKAGTAPVCRQRRFLCRRALKAMALAGRFAAASGRSCAVCPARPARSAPVAARASSGAATPPPQAATAADAQPAVSPAGLPLSRRGLLSGAAAAASVAVSGAGTALGGGWAAPPAAEAVELAPLGPVERVGGDKLVGLTPEQVKVSSCGVRFRRVWCKAGCELCKSQRQLWRAQQLVCGCAVEDRISIASRICDRLQDILARNLREGEYFITGDLTPEVRIRASATVTRGHRHARCHGSLCTPPSLLAARCLAQPQSLACCSCHSSAVTSAANATLRRSLPTTACSRTCSVHRLVHYTFLHAIFCRSLPTTACSRTPPTKPGGCRATSRWAGSAGCQSGKPALICPTANQRVRAKVATY